MIKDKKCKMTCKLHKNFKEMTENYSESLLEPSPRSRF